MKLTIGSRLTLVYTVVFGVLLAGISVVSYRVLAYQLDADITANLAELTSGLHGYLRFDAGKPAVGFDATDPSQVAFVEEATRYYQIFDASSGELLVQSDPLKPLGLEFTPEEVRQFRDQPQTLDMETDYGPIRLSNSVFTAADGRKYLLQVGVSLAPFNQVLNRYLALLLLSVPVGLGAALLVGRWLSGIALRPLTKLADATRTINIDDLQRRLPIRNVRDELDAVALAFNDTLARLEHAVGEMRQFSTALAHELRTPLTALRGDIELAMLHGGVREEVRRRFADQLEEIDKLKRLIDQILLLARAEGGEIPLKREPVDLAMVVLSLVEALEPVAQAKGVSLTCEHVKHVTVEGDGDWLKRVVINLIDNAIKFTSPGGHVVATVSANERDAVVTVRDSGIGIDRAMQAHVFERFFRADPARSSGTSGAGLGLSLAKWIVDHHRGRIDVASEPGAGSAFTVHLPLARR